MIYKNKKITPFTSILFISKMRALSTIFYIGCFSIFFIFCQQTKAQDTPNVSIYKAEGTIVSGLDNLSIVEKRIPQDGRTQIKIAGNVLDIRVSILPTFYGERVVMRLLMQSSQIPQIHELGFNSSLIEDVKRLLRSSHGIILVTGPTGSGKTTSLHSFLREVEEPHKNLITVEDPVEYKSDNIAQIQVNEKVGLTFASALRSILRQDPDVIMIGEIRDEETAAIAVRAALTGHLVFSTLHTNSAAATISRLADMNVEPFLISSSLLGILAQRLVRVLCQECKEEDEQKEAEIKARGNEKEIEAWFNGPRNHDKKFLHEAQALIEDEYIKPVRDEQRRRKIY
jgi:type II secretory ATPase GspE/PulE/Tfp pilus assembly ATPase PilB-like protein